MGFEEVVQGPSDTVKHVVHETGRLVGSAVFHKAPQQHAGGRGHRQAELDVVAGCGGAASSG